ncbi:MAG TPA: magnesium chelatase domain-containing protein, partial [Salinivirgaceae bacterium]|nr:magnesium chelatase domain-containing protein [Salinivirgaceae bacterium]
SKNTPLVLVGHITKIGNIAGPKVLEHLVDTVLQFEGDSNSGLRILRTTKNRFGNTAEIGIFEMQNTGLVEITNPTEFLLTPHSEQFSGTAFALINEGLRPLVVEVQALVSNSGYSTPQRTSNGYDPKRLNMLLAVLEKRAGLKLSTRDVFVNVTGGLKVTDTAADMAIAAAIIGSYLDIAISSQTCFAGEIGLSGEIRPMRNLSSRIEEANRLGFNYIITAPSKKINPQFSYIPVNDIRNLVTLISKS